MLFHTIDFAVFLPIVFAVYWLLEGRLVWQNRWIVLASLVFYGWWDWRFLSLLLLSAGVDFMTGEKIAATEHEVYRKRWLWLSIIVNLSLLGFFKYQGFFIENFVASFRMLGLHIDIRPLHYILPVGISFYTFQTMSYTIDIYRRKLQPATSFTPFLAYVSFFPQLVAGPIERATHLLPQFEIKRTFSYADASTGMRQILWGLFKKMVIADQCALLVDPVFANYSEQSGSTLFMAAILFSFQIYGDFSGYSDIAIGTARLFGFQLMQNFAFPYFSRNIAEFWRRWHISLTTWFKDYVYIPLGGNRKGRAVMVRNMCFVFLLSGFWHGPAWHFIAWGLWHTILFLFLVLLGRHKRGSASDREASTEPELSDFLSIITTYLLVCLGWVFFRAESISSALGYLQRICSPSLLKWPFPEAQASFFTITMLIFLFVVTEWKGRYRTFAIEAVGDWKRLTARWLMYLLLICFIAIFMATEEVPFLYFQF